MSEYETQGFRFVDGKVGTGVGASYVEISGVARLPEVFDTALFAAAFPNVVADSLNGTSLRVNAQRVNRRELRAGRKDATVIEKAVVDMMRGVRAPKTGGTRVTRNLPNGDIYAGTDCVEYTQLYVAALTDMGVPFDAAKIAAEASAAKMF